MKKQTQKRIIKDTVKVKLIQDIVNILVEHDEKTGHFNKYSEPEGHWSRKAIAKCKDPSNIKFVISPYEEKGLVYNVTAILKSDANRVVTSWVHEDGIAEEKLFNKDNPENPVHNIIGLTDILNMP